MMLAHTESDWAAEALNIARIVFYAIDCTTGTHILSENSEAILGVPSAATAPDWGTRILSEDRGQYERTLKAITTANKGFEIEYRIRHAATGQQLWVLDRGEGAFDETGQCTGIRGAIIDISARVSVERELRQATRLRSVVFEAARMAAWHVDVGIGRFTCTDELLDLLEIERSEFDGTPRSIERAIHPADRPAWRRANQHAIASGGRVEIEFRVPLRRGGTRWLLSRGEILLPATDQPLEAYGVMIDITERKHAEEAASRLAAIVASSEDAIISKNLRGIVTSWNNGAERLFGYTEAEMVGESIARIVPYENASEETTILRTIRRGEAIAPFETVRVHKNGRVIDVSVAVSPIRNGQGDVIGASTIARDVTERHRHVETLRENEARLRLALRSARAGAWDYDLQKRELHWSPEMFALYGLDPSAGEPKRESLAEQIVPAHRKRARMEFSKAMLQGGSFTLEFPIIRPDGSEIWTALVGDVIKDQAGHPVSARGIDQDITERKNWEKRQAILLRELSHRVKNTLAVIQSVARQTLRSSRSPKAFVDAFEGRIRSLAASHSILTEADWSGARLDTVIRSQVAPLVENFENRVNMRGVPVVLAAEIATQLGLVVHELATNAAKYGSLSSPEGCVDIVWLASKDRLRLLWRERGGPEIDRPPDFAGFGTLLIQSSTSKVSRRFDRLGFSCKLEFAL
jgi:PAS domain S-box-containing protein